MGSGLWLPTIIATVTVYICLCGCPNCLSQQLLAFVLYNLLLRSLLTCSGDSLPGPDEWHPLSWGQVLLGFLGGNDSGSSSWSFAQGPRITKTIPDQGKNCIIIQIMLKWSKVRILGVMGIRIILLYRQYSWIVTKNYIHQVDSLPSVFIFWFLKVVWSDCRCQRFSKCILVLKWPCAGFCPSSIN